MADSELQRRLEQLARRLVDDAEAWERSTRERRREAMTHLTAQVAEQLTSALERQRMTSAERRADRRARREAARAERRADAETQREAKRERERAEATYAGGAVALVAAAAMVAMASLHTELFWLIFVALGVGLGGVKQIRFAAARERLALPPAAQPAEATRAPSPPHEVDVLCEQLLADLQAAPEAVRQFVQRPQETIASLRATARALDMRRQQLLAERPRERLDALAVQRATIETRAKEATDEVTRHKLTDALASLDGQRAALEQLATYAERIDGEYTSLLASLQELRTRVSVARTVSAGGSLDGLKLSVDRLNAELEAIASAMDAVATGRLEPVAPIGTENLDGTLAPTRERA